MNILDSPVIKLFSCPGGCLSKQKSFCFKNLWWCAVAELNHIISSKLMLSKNAHYQLKRHFPLHSIVFKPEASHPQGIEITWGDHTPAEPDSGICIRSCPLPPHQVVLMWLIPMKIVRAHCEEHSYSRSVLQLFIKTLNFTCMLEDVRTSNVFIDFYGLHGQNPLNIVCPFHHSSILCWLITI